jgi:simple sugar transport system permease protein
MGRAASGAARSRCRYQEEKILSDRKLSPKTGGNLKRVLRYKDISIVIITAVLLLIFSLVNKSFLKRENLYIILKTMPELGIVAIGMTMLIISGEFDLSVGSTFALAPFIMAALNEQFGFHPVLALFICFLAGMAIGSINGVITTKVGIPSFITTLGTMMAWRGAVLLLSSGFPQAFNRDLPMSRFFAGSISGFPVQFIWFILFAVLMWVVLEQTRFGNWTYVTGGNRNAAIAMGIPVDLVKTINFMILGGVTAIAGAIQVFRMGSAYSIAGTGLELQAIGATVIGGTLLSGGSGTIVGTIMGTVIIFSVENIIVLSRAPAFWFRTFIGVIVIVAVSAHILIQGRKQQ